MSFIKKALPFTALILILASFLYSFLKFSITNGRERYILYFDSPNSEKLCTETRFLSKDTYNIKERAFVDELLLGPFTNRYIPLFNKNTVCEFCFVRNKTLYVGISKEALSVSKETAEIKRGIEVFKKNILKNFKNITTIEMYIDGKQVWEGE